MIILCIIFFLLFSELYLQLSSVKHKYVNKCSYCSQLILNVTARKCMPRQWQHFTKIKAVARWKAHWITYVIWMWVYVWLSYAMTTGGHIQISLLSLTSLLSAFLSNTSEEPLRKKWKSSASKHWTEPFQQFKPHPSMIISASSCHSYLHFYAL